MDHPKLHILLIGSGGREHALAKALIASASCASLYAAPGNPGIHALAQPAQVDVADFAAVTRFCSDHGIDLVVVGPDQALADGIADELRTNNIPVFGPSRAAARIEWSKSFSKELMAEAGIPTASYRRFTVDEEADAIGYVRQHTLPVVIKADGLALGKGVVVATTHDEACEAVREMFGGAFNEAGSTIVIEEFLHGEEASVFAISDGERFVTLAPAQDHKRAHDGDQGKNTGGMGSFAPAAIVTPTILKAIEHQIIEPLLRTLRERGTPFIGCVFAGLMIHEHKASVVEFNARFGDPETQSVLSVFRGDFAALLNSAAHGSLDTSTVTSTSEGVACTVVLASDGYPDAYEKGFEITGIEHAEEISTVYHAGTVMKDVLRTNGGRVVGVTACAQTLDEAREKAYMAASRIGFANKMMRSDIGLKGLAAERRLHGSTMEPDNE